MRPQLLTINEVAARLNLHPVTVRRMVYRGELVSIRLARRAIRVRKADVDSLIRRNLQNLPASGFR